MIQPPRRPAAATNKENMVAKTSNTCDTASAAPRIRNQPLDNGNKNQKIQLIQPPRRPATATNQYIVRAKKEEPAIDTAPAAPRSNN